MSRTGVVNYQPTSRSKDTTNIDTSVPESNAVTTIRWYELVFIVVSAIGVTSMAVYGMIVALSVGSGL